MKAPELIYNATIIDSLGMRHGWVATDGTQITNTGTGDAPEELIRRPGAKNALNAFLIPGLIDSHVHFRQPGLTRKGNIATESLAAEAGGITSVFDMPNTIPPTTTVEALIEKIELGKKLSAVNYHAFFGATPGCLPQLRKLDPKTTPGIKIFLGTSTGAMQAPDNIELLEVFSWCAINGKTAVIHAEDNEIIAQNTQHLITKYGGPENIPVQMHHIIRSHNACFAAAARAVELAHKTGAHIHLAHISTAREARELLSPGPTKGKTVTAETTPLYLDPILAIPENRTSLHKINPAIKTPEDREELIKALADGRIDTIATDHAPHQLFEKQGSALTAASGAPSVQFALQIMLTYLPIELIVEKMTAGPATVFGIDNYGALTPGASAQMAIVSKTYPHIIAAHDIISPCRWSPFEGRTYNHKIETFTTLD